MTTDTIRRQYNEVIATHYDLDPQSITGNTLDRAVRQISKQGILDDRPEPIRVYDVGMGTGLFLMRLRALAGDRIQPFGLDLSQKMIDCAYQKLPDLVGAVDTAANLEAHFPGQAFDLISTHFISGFVPLQMLAPKVWCRLEVGGYWSYLGATKGSYPGLQATVNSRLLRWTFGAPPLDVNHSVLSPKDQQEVFTVMEETCFVIRQCETFEPKLHFRDFDEFLEFAYYGGWLTPFIEAVGLHKLSALKRYFLNRFIFPMDDHHVIEIHLAQKVTA